MKRILINATQPEEQRVAIVDGQRLDNLDIEHKANEQKKSNIYKAKVTRIEPSLEAVFVDYGAERHGFLPFKEVAHEYLSEAAFVDEGRPSVKEGLSEDTELIVQVSKEERGNKGAALTTYISLAGRYLVLMPNNARAGGVSRRIEGSDRNELHDVMRELVTPEGMGVIARTAGVGKSTEELQWDLNYQADIWHAIKAASETKAAPFLIYQESNVIIRALRDNFNNDIGEILIDNRAVYEDARRFVDQCIPASSDKLRHYQDSIPLFNRFQIEVQIESAFQREVSLPSGGAIVIDHTEALVSIDINSARATRGSDIEETALNTNLEAADEIARQLRLRDLGGLVVIDFIDMMANKNQRAVENRLRDALKLDRARIQTNRISKFGLVEMSRQRLRPSLDESTQRVCPRCTGSGTIRSIESLALSVLRLMEEEAMKENTARVLAHVPVDVSCYLLNEKRESISSIEARNDAHFIIVPSPSFETPQFHIERVRSSDTGHAAFADSSYALKVDSKEPYVPNRPHDNKSPDVAAVSNLSPNAPIPTTRSATPGLIARLIAWIFSRNNKKSASRRGRSRRARNQYSRGQDASGQRRNNTRRDSSRQDQSQGRHGKSAGNSSQRNRSSQPHSNNDRRGGERKSKAPSHEQQSGNVDTDNNPSSSANDGNQEGERNDQRRSKRGGHRRRRVNNTRKPRQAQDNQTRDDNERVDSGDRQDVTGAACDVPANNAALQDRGDGDGRLMSAATQSVTVQSNNNVSAKQPSDLKNEVRSFADKAATASSDYRQSINNNLTPTSAQTPEPSKQSNGSDNIPSSN